MDKKIFEIKNLVFFVLLRLFFRKKNILFGNFINNMSIFGISIAISVLVLSSSIMNGLEHKINSKILNLRSHLVITLKNKIDSKIKNEIFFSKDIKQITPIIKRKAIIYTEDYSFEIGKLIVINKFNFKNYKYNYYFSNFKNKNDGVLLSKNFAELLKLHLGDKIYLFFPQFNYKNIKDIFLKRKFFYFSGFFFPKDISDENKIIVFYKKKKNVINITKGFFVQLEVLLKNPFLVKCFKDKHKNKDFEIRTWEEKEKELFSLVFLEKNISNFLFILIIVIVVVNIIILINLCLIEKEKDIAILLTLGIRKNTIFFMFFFQCLINFFLGSFLGTTFGILITKNINFLIKFAPVNINFLMIEPIILSSEIFLFNLLAIIFSFLSILYPIYRLTKINPSKVLEHE